MKLSSLFAQGKFVVSGEVGPPKGVDPGEVIEGASMMAPHVDAVNVTDNQSAVMRLGSLAVSHLLKREGIEPVFQMVCRDRNRIALQSDLLSAAALGVENVLALTGDHMVLGDHLEAKPVFDLDSVQLLAAAKGLNDGRDLEGHDLKGSTDLCLGAVVNPGSDELDTQLIKMKKKIDVGAEFFQTQAIYEPDKFEAFVKQASAFNVPIIAGIVVLKSAAMARYMNENVAGIHVPEDIVQEMADTPKEDRKKRSVEISARLIRQLRPFCQGVHIMPLGWDELVPEIIEAAGLG